MSGSIVSTAPQEDLDMSSMRAQGEAGGQQPGEGSAGEPGPGCCLQGRGGTLHR